MTEASHAALDPADLPRRYDLRRHHFEGEEGHLIPLLQQAQSEDGYLSRDRMEAIHRATGVPMAHIFGVATFYAQFRLSPAGRHLVRVCHGTACHVAGAREITRAVEEALHISIGETTPDRAFTLETVSCVGCCSLAPVVMIDSTTHGNLDDRGVTRALARVRRADAGGEPCE